MALNYGFALVASALVLSGCGQGTETQSTSTPADAETPYAEEPTPPAHADVAVAAEPEQAAQDAAAFKEAAASIDTRGDKVGNVTAEIDDDLGAVKDVAVMDDELKAAAASSGDPFGGIIGDAERGKRLFLQCQGCHSVAEGQNRAGPSLYEIVGRSSGAVEGYRYSAANANANIVWTEDALFAYLENPREYMPGTTMIFPGVPKPQDRADIIAFLKLQTD